MKKSDLKTGMMVETKRGCKYIVLKDVETKYYGIQNLLFAGENGFTCGMGYTEDLKDKLGKDMWDIDKIYSIASKYKLLKVDIEGRRLLWEREPAPIEMTLEEAIQKLKEVTGKPIKITI